MSDESADVWAVVELMGHQRTAGKLTEVERFGSKMGRLDIPDGDKFVTTYFGGASVYRITVVTEAVARGVAKNNQPAPVHPWDYPRQIQDAPPAEAVIRRPDRFDEDAEYDDYDDDYDDGDDHEKRGDLPF